MGLLTICQALVMGQLAAPSYLRKTLMIDIEHAVLNLTNTCNFLFLFEEKDASHLF
jgi:hypothetical protein